MKTLSIVIIAIQWTLISSEDPKSNQINQVNPDGSYQFGLVLKLRNKFEIQIQAARKRVKTVRNSKCTEPSHERDAKPNYDDRYDSEFISFDRDSSLYSDGKRIVQHNSCIYERSVAG